MQITINEGEYEYTRPHLKQWLVLEDLRIKLGQAVIAHDRENTVKYFISIVSIALSITEETLCLCPWYEIAIAYKIIFRTNLLNYDFPFLNLSVKDKKEAWDYDGRTWYVWSNIFASKYGWNLETIAELDVDDALALAQEIAIDEQLDREWQWASSEIAYQTKHGFKPLDRPDWMRYAQLRDEIPVLKIRKDMIPSGVIIRFTVPPDSQSI